jgi:LysM repeat protein
VEWKKVPAGPVCATQFQSPYEGAGVPQAIPAPDTASAATATPAPTETAPGTTVTLKYTVQRGDTLYKIATHFRVTVAAIQKANHLTGTAIFVGQVLIIPNASPDASTPPLVSSGICDPAYPTICVPPPPPDLDCSDIPYTNFEVHAPDPHRFDLDNDGTGCEG